MDLIWLGNHPLTDMKVPVMKRRPGPTSEKTDQTHVDHNRKKEEDIALDFRIVRNLCYG